MGTYDEYEPQPPLDCPICGAPSRGWQGDDGPCVFFLWRQGHRHPVDQPLDEDVRMERDRYSQFTLPRVFALVGSCMNEHMYEAIGHAPHGIWTTTEFS